MLVMLILVVQQRLQQMAGLDELLAFYSDILGMYMYHVKVMVCTWFWYLLISSQSLNRGGRRGTTDDIATIPFHPSLSPAALRESPNPIPVYSLMLSSHLFFCLPLLLAPFTVTCRIVLRCGHTIWVSFSLPWLGDYHAFQLHSVANLLVRHMVFVGNIQKSPIASHRKVLDPSLDFSVKIQLSQA